MLCPRPVLYFLRTARARGTCRNVLSCSWSLVVGMSDVFFPIPLCAVLQSCVPCSCFVLILHLKCSLLLGYVIFRLTVSLTSRYPSNNENNSSVVTAISSASVTYHPRFMSQILALSIALVAWGTPCAVFWLVQSCCHVFSRVYWILRICTSTYTVGPKVVWW